MIQSFAGRGTEDVFTGEDTRAARKCCSQQLWGIAQRRLSVLDSAKDLRDLKSPGNHPERLGRDRAGQWAVRINSQYRVCFRWENGDAYDVEIVDYH